jgi:putative peptide zinc metalloprotease protein
VNITLAVVGAAGLFVVFCPLPYQVTCPLEIKPRDADPVYIDVAGILVDVNVKPWDKVNVGDPLGRLRSTELEMEILDLEAKLNKQRVQAQVLQRARRDDPAAMQTLPEIMEMIDSLQEQLSQKHAEGERLQLVARSSGTILPPPSVKSDSRGDGALPQWSGSPLDPENLGAYVGSTLFCQIGDPRKWEAELVVDQDYIEFIHEDQEVAIKLDEMPYETFYSTIEEIGPEMEFSSRQLSSKTGGELMTKQDASGAERPISTSFQARAPLDDPGGNLVQGLRGTAKVYADWQPLGKRFWRFLVRTFNFDL